MVCALCQQNADSSHCEGSNSGYPKNKSEKYICMIIENLKSSIMGWEVCQFIKNTGLYFPYNMTFVGICQNNAVFKGTLFIAAFPNGKMISWFLLFGGFVVGV